MYVICQYNLTYLFAADRADPKLTAKLPAPGWHGPLQRLCRALCRAPASLTASQAAVGDIVETPPESTAQAPGS